MLSGVVAWCPGRVRQRSRLAAAERMEFDAEHTKGLVGRRAKRIVECAPKKRSRKS